MRKIIGEGIYNRQLVPLPVVFCNGGKWVEAWCPVVDIASQGRDFEEAKKNIQEALDLFFEDEDAPRLKLKSLESVTVSVTTVPVRIKGSAHAKKETAVCS